MLSSTDLTFKGLNSEAILSLDDQQLFHSKVKLDDFDKVINSNIEAKFFVNQENLNYLTNLNSKLKNLNQGELHFFSVLDLYKNNKSENIVSLLSNAKPLFRSQLRLDWKSQKFSQWEDFYIKGLTILGGVKSEQPENMKHLRTELVS